MRRFKNILCVVTPDKSSAPALERALALATANHANLKVVSVVPQIFIGMGAPDNGPISRELQQTIITEREDGIRSMMASAGIGEPVEIETLVGIQFLEIIREVLRSDHDLVIKPADESHWSDRALGSEDTHLLRKCPCPVWLIKQKNSGSFRRILAAVDIDDAYPEAELRARNWLNIRILQLATSLAEAESVELHILHAWKAAGEDTLRGPLMRTSDREVDTYVEAIRQQREEDLSALVDEVINADDGPTELSPAPKIHLVKGRVRKTIPALAAKIDADLVIMGTVARTGVPGFIMGNTAESALSHIDCSVLAIKPVGFETPVKLVDDKDH